MSAATGDEPEAVRERRSRVAVALDHPRVWRATAALAAILLLAIILIAAQGSVTILAKRPMATRAPAWSRWCTRGEVRTDRRRLAFCARVAGIVLAYRHGAPGEVHVALIGDFHLTIVRLPDGSATPTVGARVAAVGPLVRARDGQREVQAFRWVRT